MTSLLFFVVLLAALFAFSFFTKRRFGVLGLGLAAGELLSLHWSDTVTPFIEQQGIVLVSPPLSSIVQVALLLLPPILMLMSGPSYDKMWQRVVGSLAFMLLAFTFMVGAIGDAVLLDGYGRHVFNFFDNYQSLLIVGGVILAITDVLLTGKHKKR